MKASSIFLIEDASQIGESRRGILQLCEKIGFDETDRGKIAIVVNELANNLIYHSNGSRALISREIDENKCCGLEILSLDRGPGMMNVQQCLEDGYSTRGGAGTGLGAVRRLSSFFDIYSEVGKGTAILFQLKHSRDNPDLAELNQIQSEFGAVCLPMHGEEVCGDTWAIETLPSSTKVMVADGLGHGPEAFKVAEMCRTIFHDFRKSGLKDILNQMHSGLKNTRGAAVSMADINYHLKKIFYVGVGNVSGLILSKDKVRRLISHGGTIGYMTPRTQEFIFDLELNSHLILYSDGIYSQLNLEAYPNLWNHHPSLMAGIIHRDFCRGKDDSTVLVIQI